LKLDKEETKKARTEERKKRIARGKSFDVFNEEWQHEKMDEENLKFYGSWPDANIIEPLMRA